MSSTTHSSQLIHGPQGPHIAPQHAINIPDNVKINNNNGKNNNNEQNNSESLEDKKSSHSII